MRAVTREEYERDFRRWNGISAEVWPLLGLHVVPCWCGGTMAGCSGWTVEFIDPALRREYGWQKSGK